VGDYVAQSEPSLARILRRLLTSLRLAKRAYPAAALTVFTRLTCS
jgi:hypothetical protein